ncbi:SIAH-type domain [Phytophthora cactorum]|nr:SIAH-type domain [Phytophthora cactorum]
MTPCDLFVSDGDDDRTRALELHPQKAFAGNLSGTMVFTFYSKNAWMKTVEIARPLRVYWKANAVDEPAANATQVFGPFELQSVVFEYETVSISPRSLVVVAFEKVLEVNVRAELVFESIDLKLPEWSDWVLMHRSRGDHEWLVGGAVHSSNSSWAKQAEVVLAPQDSEVQAVTLFANVSFVEITSGDLVVVVIEHTVRVVVDPRLLVHAALNDALDLISGKAVLIAPADAFFGVVGLSFGYIFTEATTLMKIEVEIRVLLYWMPAPKEVEPVSMELTSAESRNATISGEVLDGLISSVFVDPAYRRDFLLFTSSTPLNFTVQPDKSDGYQLVPANPYFSGFATLKLKAVLQDKNIPVGETSTSHRHFGALPNVTVVVTVDLFIAPAATVPLVNATVVRPTPPVGTAVVLSIGVISLRDLDGSEDLSVELAAEVESDTVAVFFNGQLLQAEPAPEIEWSNSDGETPSPTKGAASSDVVYALPVPASTEGIVDAEVMLIAVDTLFTGRFNISLTATSRELYFTSKSNATMASAVLSGEVGWLAEPAIFYGEPLDFWLEAPEDTTVSFSLSSIRERLLADVTLSDVNEVEYGPCRLVWDTGRVQAVFVDDARMQAPVSLGGGFGSLTFAEHQAIDFGVSETLSVIPGLGFYGEVTGSLSVDAYSPTLSQVYRLSGALRISVVPVAGSRFFSAMPNGSAPIHLGFNRELDLVVSEDVASSALYCPYAEMVFFLVDVDNADAVVEAQDLPFWRYGHPSVGGALWTPNAVFVLDEVSESINSTLTVLPPQDYVGSLSLALQSVAMASGLIPSEVVASENVSEASGSKHAWLMVLSTSIVEVVLPTQWNHAQAPQFGVANASSRVYEDELGALWISELSVAELDATAPDMNVSLEVLLPQNCNLSVSVNGSTLLESGSETLDNMVFAVVPVSVASKTVYIAAGPSHSTRVGAFLRASVYAFNSWNMTSVPVTLEFLTVAEKPLLSVAMTNTSISEGGVFSGTISVVPTKADLYYRVRAFYPSGYIGQVGDYNWTGIGNVSQEEAEAGMVYTTSIWSRPTWSTSLEGTTGQLVPLIATGQEPTIIPLWLVPVAKVSGNFSVDIVVVAFTVDVDPDLFVSKCFLDISSDEEVYQCLPQEQWKSVATVSESMALTIYPVAEAPRFVVYLAEESIMENGVATLTLSNWTLGDVDGSEEMYIYLSCGGGTWKEVSIDGADVVATKVPTLSTEQIAAVSTTVFELLLLGVYRSDGSSDLSVQLTPPSYFSGSIGCNLVAHAVDRSGAFVSEDTYETPLSVTVIAEATVPLVSIATTSFMAVEDGVVVCDSVAASLVDVDGSEALFLVVDLGEYEQYVTSVTWRSESAVVAFSTQADGVVPAMVYGGPSQRIVAAGSGRMEMRGSVEIGLVAGYSGDLRFSMWSASVELVYLETASLTDAAVATTSPISVDVSVSPVANMPMLNATFVQPVSRVGTVIVLSIGAISLLDLDGSEDLSVELAAEVESDTVAVFFNGQLLQAEPAPEIEWSNSDGETPSPTKGAASSDVVYALPVPASTEGIVDAEVMLIAVDTLFTGRFNISLTATSRELYFTSKSNATMASAVLSGEVGWLAEPAIFYGEPLDFWLEAPEDTTVSFSLSSIRERLLADVTLSDVNEVEYGPCRLVWDTGRVQAVFVDDARMQAPVSLGGGFGSLTFAEHQAIDFGVSETLSVIPGLGFYGEVTGSLSVDAYSPTLSQVYRLSGALRISVVPVAGSRFFSAMPNGSAPIHLGFNRELDLVVSEDVASSALYCPYAEMVFFLVDVDNADAVVEAQDLPFWRYGHPSVGGALWTPNAVFVLDEVSESINSTLTVLPPQDYVGSLSLALQSVAMASGLIPSEVVASENVSEASGSKHAWLMVLSTSIVEVVLPTQWNHAQAPQFGVANASSRVYEDELGALWISELSVAELDATAPDMNVSLEVLLPQNCNLSVSVNGSTLLESGSETLDNMVFAVVPVSVASKTVYIAAGPSHSTRVGAFLRASVYAFNSWNMTSVPVTLEFLTVAEKPLLSVAMTNTSISEGGVFSGTISVVPTKADLYYRVQTFYPSAYIAPLTNSSTSASWSTGADGVSGNLLSFFSTQLGSGVGSSMTTSLSLVPVSKISGNLSVDVVVVTSTVDVAQDLFVSDCYLNSSDVFGCLPSAQWKSIAVTSQLIPLVIYPVAEAPRLVMTPAVLSITENGEASVTLNNWTLTDIDGSESMDLRLRCTSIAWQKVVVNGIVSNISSATGDFTTTTFELLLLGIYRSDGSSDLSVQLTPPSYFSGSIGCNLVAHAVDRSGAFVSEDTYETPLSVTVIAEATVPLVSIATTSFMAVEDGVVVCDSVAASLVDVDGSEALFLVVDLGEYEQYVTSVTWRSESAVVAFSTQADGVVPAMVYGGPSQQIVAAGSGRMEMRGSVEIGLVAGYSGDLRFSMWSVSVERTYLASTVASYVAVARASSIGISVAVSPICHVADVVLSPVSAVTKPLIAVPIQVIASTIDTDGSEVLATQVSVNCSAVFSLYGSNSSENWLVDTDTVMLPPVSTQDVFRLDQTFTVVPRADFVGFFMVNVTVKTTELATGETKLTSKVTTVLVTPVDPVVRVSAVSRGYWNEFLQLPFQRLDVHQEDASREHLLLYVENRTQVADVYAGFKRLVPVTLGAVDVYVVPYTLGDVISVRPRQYWYGYMKLFAIVTTVAFDLVSMPNRTAYQGTGDGIVIMDLPVTIHPRPVSPSYSLATSSDVSVSGKPFSLTFNGVLPYDAWGGSTGVMATQLALAPLSITDSLSTTRSVVVSKVTLRGVGAYGTYSTSNISGDTHLHFTVDTKSAYTGTFLTTVITNTTDVLRQTLVTNVSNSKVQLIGEAERGMLGFGKAIRVFQVGDNQNVTFRLADFGLMSELTDLVSAQAFIVENAVDAVAVGSTQLSGETDSQWGATLKFGDLRYELHGTKSPACITGVEPCLLNRLVTISPRRYAAQTFNMTVRITSRVSANDNSFGSLSTVTTIARCRVVVAPVPNTPLLVLNSTTVTTLEDVTAAFMVVEASTPDRDGSEVIEVEMSFDPLYLDAVQVDGVAVSPPTVAGTVVLIPRSSAVSNAANRVVSLVPRRNFAGNFTAQVAVTSIERSTGETTRVSTTVTVNVVAVADAPVLGIGTSEVRVNQNVPGELTITSVGLTDDDSSETLRLVVIDSSGSALKTVEVIGASTSKFVLASLHLSTLTLRFTAIAAWFGSAQLQINAVSRESSNGNEFTTSATVTLTVYPVADPPSLMVENTRGQLTQATRIGLVSVGIPTEAKINATSITVYLLPRSSDAIEVKWQSQVLSLTLADVSTSAVYRLPSNSTLQQPTLTVSTTKWVSSVSFEIVAVASISASTTTQRTSQVVTVTFGAIQLSATSLSLTEGASGALTLVMLSAPLNTVTVTLTSTITTKAVTVPATATFTATDWNVAKIIQIQAVNNFLEDANAVATITGATASTDAVYSGFSIPTVTVEVLNDDVSGFAVYQGSSKTTAPALVVAEGHVFTDTYNIVLQAQPTADVSVAFSTSLAILLVSPTSVTFTAANWNVSKAITVTADDNFAVDGDRTATLSAAVTSTDPLFVTKTIASLNVKIVETKDTTPPPKLLDAKFLDTAVGLTITFDRAVDRTTLTTDNFACSVLFDLPSATDSTSYCGASPACTWQTGSTSIRFVFGQGVRVEPGSTLTLRGNLLKSTAAAELAAPATTVTISAPDKPPHPQVLVSGAASLGMCDDLVLDGSSSSGSGGRPMTYTWMLVNTTSVTSTSLDAVTALLTSATTTSNATIKIPAPVLEADGTYSFILLAKNFFGKTGNSNEILVKKSGLALPSVAIKGGNLQGAYRANELVITASASYPSCSGPVTTDTDAAVSTGVDMTFTWLQVAGDLTATQFKSTSPNPRILKLPARTLTVGVSYVFRLVAAMASNLKVNNSADVQVGVARTDLTAMISAGNRSIGVEQDLALDASLSVDPDDVQNSVSMQYSWTCWTLNASTQVYDVACLTATGETLTLDTQAKITVAASTVNPNTVYKFALTVSKDTRSSSTSVFIIMTPGSPPKVSIDALGSAKVNSNDRVILKGKVASKLPVTKTEWTIVGASDATMSSVFAVPRGRLMMLVSEGKLTPGISYKFQLNATDSSGQTGSATITVVANSPPSSGSLSVTPAVGYALEDKFSVLVSDWVDEDLPLKYTFKYIKGATYSGENEIALGASTPDALFLSQLGLGGGDNNTVTLVVYVQDALGATTRVTKEIQVKPMVVAAANQAAYLANKTNAVLAEALTGDPGKVLNTINALADMVNGKEETANGTTGNVSTPATTLKSCPTSSYVECGGKGSCVREPTGCLASNVDCIVTCVCTSGYYGDNCALDEAAMTAKSAALGTLLGAMTKASASVDVTDVGALEQQAASVVTLTKSATILDSNSQKLVLNVMDNILAAPVLTPAATTAVANTISNLLENPTPTPTATTKSPTPTPTATTKTPSKSRRLADSSSDSSGDTDSTVGGSDSGSSVGAGSATTDGSAGSTSSSSGSTSNSDAFAAEKVHVAHVASTIGKLQTAMLSSAVAGEDPITLVTKNLRLVGARDTASQFSKGRTVQLPLSAAQIAANYTPASTTFPTDFSTYLKSWTNGSASSSGAEEADEEEDPIVDFQSNVFAKNPYAFDNTSINSRVMTVKVSSNGQEVAVHGLETPFRLLMRNLVPIKLLVNDTTGNTTSTSGSASNNTARGQRYTFYCLEGTIDVKYFNCTDIEEPMIVQCNGSSYAGEATCPVRQPSCTYWDTTTGTWSSEGCQAVGTTDDGLYTVCECTHLTDFSSEVTQSLSLVTEHFMNVVTHEVTVEDVEENLLLILTMTGFFLFYVVAVFYVNRWDYRDRRKAMRATRQMKRGSAPPDKLKLRSLFQEPEYLQAKDWRSKLRAVVVGFGRGLKQHHKLLSIVFKYNESFSRAQRLTVVFTLVASHMFVNALLYQLKKGRKSLGSSVVSAVITTVCLLPVGFVLMMMFKKAGRMQKYLIRYQIEDDAGNVVEVETDAYGRAKEYSLAEQLSMDLAALARGVDMSALRLVHDKLKQREDGARRDQLETRSGQVCRGIFLALYNRDADVKPPEHHEGDASDDPLAGVLVQIKSHLREQKSQPHSEDTHRHSRLLSALPFRRNSQTEAETEAASVGGTMPPAAPVQLDMTRIDEEDEAMEAMEATARKTLAMSQLCAMLKRQGGEALVNSMLKFDPLLVSASSAASIAGICDRLDVLEEEEEEEEDDTDENSSPQTREEDEETKAVLALQAWLVKCNESCAAQQTNARVIVAKAQAELERTETQLKKLRDAIGNEFDRRMSEAMALELNGPNANDLLVKTRQSVRRVSRRPSNVQKAEASVREDKRRITVTIKKDTQAVLKANQAQLAEKRKAIKKAKRAAATEQRRLKRERKHEQDKVLEGLRGIARLKKRLRLYVEAREERKIAALPLHERQAYLTEKEQLKKIRRTSRLLYNAFLRRQPAQQSKPLLPEWVVYFSYTICAVWSAWCVYFVLMFAFTIGQVEAQLWMTSLLSGLALTYVISDPLKLFFRMGLMPIIATGILANSGFFSALSSEPMALGAAVVAAGAGGMAGYVAKHRAESRERRNQRRLTKASSRKLVPVSTAEEENSAVEQAAQADAVVALGRVDANDSGDESEGDTERKKDSFTDLTRLSVRDSVFNEAPRDVPKLAVKKGPPVQMLRSSEAVKAEPPIVTDSVSVAPVAPTRECVCGMKVLETQWTEHETARCSLRIVTCRAGCGRSMLARGRDAHERSHCRLIMCECGKMVLTPSLELHRAHECTAVASDDRVLSPRVVPADRDPVVPCRLPGCATSMRASRRLEHEHHDCSFRLVLCRRCGVEKPAEEMDTHLSRECTQRRQSPLTLCACGKMVRRDSMESHEKNECSQREAASDGPVRRVSSPPVLVTCRLPGCTARMVEALRESHERDCSFRLVTCPRCSTERSAADMEQHLTSCAQRRQSQLSLCGCGKLVMKGAAHSCTTTGSDSAPTQPQPLLVACRLSGCNARMRAALREAHERHECAFRLATCTRCGVERHAADMETHLADECALQRAQQSVQRSMSAFAPPSVVVPKLNKKSIRGPPSPNKKTTKPPAISTVIDIQDESTHKSGGSPPRGSPARVSPTASVLPGRVQSTEEALKVARMREKVLARREPPTASRASRSRSVAASPTSRSHVKPQLSPPRGRPVGSLFSGQETSTVQEVTENLEISPLRRKMMAEHGGPPAPTARVVPSPREDEVAAAIAGGSPQEAPLTSTVEPAPVTQFTLEEELVAAETETKPPAPRSRKGSPKSRSS